MTYYYYAIVLKKTVNISNTDRNAAESLMNRYIDIFDYFVNRMSENCKIQFDHCFEIKQKKNNKINLHMHAMLKSDRDLTLESPPAQKGMSIYFEVCNKIAWDIYCAKQRYTFDDVLEYIDTQIYGLHYQEREEHTHLMQRLKTIRLV